MKSHPVFPHLLAGLIPRVAMLGALSLLLTACVCSSDSQAVDTLIQFFSPRPTATPEIMADCFIDFKLTAWEDRDGSGIRAAAEPPLADVEFRIQGSFALMLSQYPCVSNEAGTCTMRLWTPELCAARAYTLIAVAPENFQPTTPTEVTIEMSPADSSAEVQFGFMEKED